MIHISKLAVGIRGIRHLAQEQAKRLGASGRVHHLTRLAPRRADELLNGGSIYWVICGSMQARQRVTGVEPSCRQDGTPCTALILDPRLIPVQVRAVRAFQGWRYLEPSDAPKDEMELGEGDQTRDLPESMRRSLRSLGLL